MKIRIGTGYDIHPLKAGKPLFLGGVKIPFSKGLAGHSDGDCLIHSIIDALLGALGEKDIGQFFPDTDERYFNVYSIRLLEDIVGLLREHRVEIMNIDSVVVAEQPKLNDFIPEMKNLISKTLMISRASIGIKATTNEGMDAIGRGEAIAAYATVLVRKKQ